MMRGNRLDVKLRKIFKMRIMNNHIYISVYIIYIDIKGSKESLSIGKVILS